MSYRTVCALLELKVYEKPDQTSLVINSDSSVLETYAAYMSHWDATDVEGGGMGAGIAGGAIDHDGLELTRTLLGEMVGSGQTRNYSVGEVNQGGFTWDGGVPASEVNLDDYPDGVWRAAEAVSRGVNPMEVVTDRLDDGYANPHAVSGGFIFVKGRAESERGHWPGRTGGEA